MSVYSPQQSGQRIAVIIPAFQEERLLPITLDGIPAWVDLLIVVDDASTDRTRQVALSFARESVARSGMEVRILSLSQNCGVGRAIIVGYIEAWGAGADIAIVMGADAQMDPREIPQLLGALESGVAYVKGNRMRHPEVKLRMPWVRYLGNKVLSVLTGWIMAKHGLSDAQCGYTALDLRWLPYINLAHLYPRYGFPNDVLLRLSEAGAEVRQVDVTPIYGDERSKLSIPRVIFPILGVLGRGIFRRCLRLLHLRRVRRYPERDIS